MEFMTSFHLPEILAAIAVAVFLHLWRFGKKRAPYPNNSTSVPEIPGALPLVGHLHLLGGKQPLARKLASFSDKYGPVFAIRLGTNNLAVVVSDYDAIKECFTTNDRVLAFRPDSTQSKILGYNNAVFGFASYGDYFRYIKKILISGLLSPHRIKSLRTVHISEIDSLVHDLYQQSMAAGGGQKAVVISMSEAIHSCAINIITRIVTGKRYFDKTINNDHDKQQQNSLSSGRPISEAIREFMLLMGTLVPSDLVPALRWVLPQGTVKAMKRLFKELDAIMESWIDEHKEKQRLDNETSRDLIDFMLSEITDEVAFGFKRETIIKAIIHAAIFGGSDTTAVTLTWSLSNLLNHKQALQVAQEEIDNVVGRDRWVEDSDIENLTYLRAVVKETLRMYPAAALSVPRVASEDITIKGFHVEKGTQFLANFWKLHRDLNVWSDPDEFKPERFLTDNVDIQIFGHQFEYLPFGTGRRGCPGMNFGMQAVQLTLARLLQGFHWSTPGDKPVDMTEDLGIILSKTHPLQVVLTPRLPPRFYNV